MPRPDASNAHDRAFWRTAIGERRPDGTMREGPASFGNAFWAWVGRPSVEIQERHAKEARRQAALDAARARSATRRKATPAPALVTPITQAPSLRARRAGKLYPITQRRGTR